MNKTQASQTTPFYSRPRKLRYHNGLGVPHKDHMDLSCPVQEHPGLAPAFKRKTCQISAQFGRNNLIGGDLSTLQFLEANAYTFL